MNFKCWKYSLISALVISGAIISWQRYAFAQSDNYCQPGQTCNHRWHPWEPAFRKPEELQKLYPQAIRQLQHEDPQAIQKLKRLEPETVERLEQLAPNSRQQLQR